MYEGRSISIECNGFQSTLQSYQSKRIDTLETRMTQIGQILTDSFIAIYNFISIFIHFSEYNFA
jgi:hypothetical protein